MSTLIYAYFYLTSSYKATSEGLDEANSFVKSSEVSISEDSNLITISPKNPDNKFGVIFLQGGKVDTNAYVNIMTKLSYKFNSKVYIPKLLFNIAFLSPNAPDNIINSHPEIENWVLIGHSLGGVVMGNFYDNTVNTPIIRSIQCIKAPCLQKCTNSKKISNIVFWGSYANANLTDNFSNCLSNSNTIVNIKGDIDGELDMNSFNLSVKNVPNDFSKFITITGLNHSTFGDYGLQSGDHQISRSKDELQQEIIDDTFQEIFQNSL